MELTSIPFFASLNDEQLSILKEIVREIDCQSGEILFLEGESSDAFYLVLIGEIRIVKGTTDGKEKILDIMTKGDFFGEMGVLEAKTRSASAYVRKKSRLLVIEKDDFVKVLKDNPEIALKIIVELSRRLRWANKEIEGLAFYDVETRLKNLFLRLAKKSEDEMIISRKLTHQVMAKYIGASRETVTRLINKMEDKALLEIKKNKIMLKNMDRW
ncbi:MAG: Crp/Fnr family transcriptional regulator [Halothermotrichaceae bacterium]